MDFLTTIGSLAVLAVVGFAYSRILSKKADVDVVGQMLRTAEERKALREIMKGWWHR